MITHSESEHQCLNFLPVPVHLPRYRGSHRILGIPAACFTSPSHPMHGVLRESSFTFSHYHWCPMFFPAGLCGGGLQDDHLQDHPGVHMVQRLVRPDHRVSRHHQTSPLPTTLGLLPLQIRDQDRRQRAAGLPSAGPGPGRGGLRGQHTLSFCHEEPKGRQAV